MHYLIKYAVIKTLHIQWVTFTVALKKTSRLYFHEKTNPVLSVNPVLLKSVTCEWVIVVSCILHAVTLLKDLQPCSSELRGSVDPGSPAQDGAQEALCTADFTSQLLATLESEQLQQATLFNQSLETLSLTLSFSLSLSLTLSLSLFQFSGCMLLW